MLVLLDERTWTSGADTAKFVEHLHRAMRIGVDISCVHQLPAVVGPPRHACDFSLMFNDDWTPAHLTRGPANLYKEMDLALKGEEWRQPGLVALAARLATSAGEHKPIKVTVPKLYEPKTGLNPWALMPARIESPENPSFGGDGKARKSRFKCGMRTWSAPALPALPSLAACAGSKVVSEPTDGAHAEPRVLLRAGSSPPKPAPPPGPSAMGGTELTSLPPAMPVPPPSSGQEAMPTPPADASNTSVTEFLTHRLKDMFSFSEAPDRLAA